MYLVHLNEPSNLIPHAESVNYLPLWADGCLVVETQYHGDGDIFTYDQLERRSN